MLDKVNGFVREYNGDKHLALFCPEKCNANFNRIRYLIGLKCSIICIDPHNYSRIKMDSDDDLPLEKTSTLYNVAILI